MKEENGRKKKGGGIIDSECYEGGKEMRKMGKRARRFL